MPEEVPERLWLPLLILETTGDLHSKTKFQKIAFLTQYESKLDVYDFIKHHYGPYSDGFDLDTVCYPSLITQTTSQLYYTPNKHYYSYYITEQGKNILSELKQKIPSDLLQTMASKIKEINEKPLCELLEEVYDKFALKKDDSLQLELQVKEELMKVMPPINNSYMKFGNRQTTFVLGILESIEKILSKSQTEDTVQKGVIFNLSKEIIQRCKDLAKDVIPPTDSNFLRPQFLEIHDLYSYLIQYCENRNIVQDPMSQSLDDFLTEDEALRLSQELEAIELPS
jgi:hypothetical protein